MPGTPANLDQQLLQSLLTRSREGDSLRLSDAVLLAALDGSRALSRAERNALQASPLTLRRLRFLSQQRQRSQSEIRSDSGVNWHESSGVLLAAASASDAFTLASTDQYWTLHFFVQDGAWRIVASLNPAAPFAASLLSQTRPICITNGASEVLLSGQLDSDGELESAWQAALAPIDYFAQHGGRFVVKLASAGDVG